MAQIKSVKEAKAAGTAIGAATELAVGDTLTARVLDVLRTMHKGKAVSLIIAFWDGFDSSAPTIRGLKRIKVTKSESLRIARGIDDGLPPVASWAESVKAAPKAETGKGSGGGRPPRQPGSAPAEPIKTVTPEAPPTEQPTEQPTKQPTKQPTEQPTKQPTLSPFVAARQIIAQLVSLTHNHKSKFSLAFLDGVEELATIAKAELK